MVEPQTEVRTSCSTGGLARRLTPEVAAGLGAISRVARALNEPGTLEELAAHALAEMRKALGLSKSAEADGPAPAPPTPIDTAKPAAARGR